MRKEQFARNDGPASCRDHCFCVLLVARDGVGRRAVRRLGADIASAAEQELLSVGDAEEIALAPVEILEAGADRLCGVACIAGGIRDRHEPGFSRVVALAIRSGGARRIATIAGEGRAPQIRAFERTGVS